MTILSCYVDDRTLATLKRVELETGRSVEDLAEAAIAEEASRAERPRPSGPVPPAPPKRLSRAQTEILNLALRGPGGNPWPLISIKQRAGGAKNRMFEQMKAWGWFDQSNCITAAGRAAIGGAA